MLKYSLLFLVSVFDLMLAFFVIYKNKRNKVNKTYFFFAISIFFWITTNLLFQIFNNQTILYILSIGAYLAAIGIVHFLFYFSIIFPKENQYYKKYKNILFTASIFISFFTSIPYAVLKKIDLIPEKSLVTTPGLYLYGLYLVIFFVWSLYNLYYCYRTSFGIAKQRALFLLSGIGISVLLGIFFNLIMPILKIYSLVWFGPVCSIFMIVSFAYAIIKYRLMNIKIIITRSLIFFFLTLATTATFVLISFISTLFFADSLGRNQYFIWIIPAVLIVLLIDPLKQGLAQVTDKVFFKGKIDYDLVLKKLTKILSEEVDVKNIILKTEDYLKKEIKLQNATLLISFGDNYFLQPEEIHNLPTTREEQKKRHFYPALVDFLQQTQEIIIMDELERKIEEVNGFLEKEALQKVFQDVQNIKAEVVCPIFRKNEISALLILDKKTSGEAFSDADINMLEVLNPQLSSALFKANLFQEAKLFNIKLKQEVDRATRELKEANKHLQELDKAKSEFMSIASHQLRTPLSGIMGYLSMIAEGDYGEISKEQQPIIKEVLAASQRMIRLVNLFLNVTRIEAGRLNLNLADINLDDLVHEQIHELMPTADKKKLILEYSKSKEKLPLISLDADKIKDVVLNLVDNSIKYSESGKIVASVYKQGEHHLKICIKDQGIGIASGEADKLFNKFVRGDNMVRINPNGSGLGLFIAKKIVEMHHGKIWVESEGLGKGSTFYVLLPLKQN